MSIQTEKAQRTQVSRCSASMMQDRCGPTVRNSPARRSDKIDAENMKANGMGEASEGTGLHIPNISYGNLFMSPAI